MSKPQDILILEASPDSLRLSHARVGDGPVVFHDARTFLSRDGREDQTALLDQNLVDRLRGTVADRGWEGKGLICVLSGAAVSCQYFDMPPLKGAALRQAVLLKLGQELHFDVNEAIVDIRPVPTASGEERDAPRVAVTAVRRESARSAIEAAAQLKCDVLAVSAAPAAIAALVAGAPREAEATRAFLHLGERHGTLVVFCGGAPCVTSELPVGLRDFTAALMRPIIAGDDVIQLDEAKAVALRDAVGIPEPDQSIESLEITGSHLIPLLEPTLQKLARHLTQWLMFVATADGGEKVGRLTIVGQASSLPGLDQAIGQRLKLEVDRGDWLREAVSADASAREVPVDSLAVAAGAALHWRSLPDLIPPEVHKQRKVRRLCRSTSLFGPVIAAAIFGIAFLFDQMGMKIQPAVGAQEENLSDIRQVVGANSEWLARREAAQQLQAEFDRFARATPNWEGLFKDLSLRLPPELRAVQFAGHSDSGGLRMTIEAIVYTDPRGRSFDEVVEHTLRSLERSPFFRRVVPVQSTAAEAGADGGEAGTLAVELELIYPGSEGRA